MPFKVHFCQPLQSNRHKLRWLHSTHKHDQIWWHHLFFCRYDKLSRPPKSFCIDPDKPEAGITILFSSGDLITQTITANDNWSPIPEATRTANPKATYSLALNFRCDSSVDGATVESWTFDETKYIYNINIISGSGKYFQIFLQNNSIPSLRSSFHWSSL